MKSANNFTSSSKKVFPIKEKRKLFDPKYDTVLLRLAPENIKSLHIQGGLPQVRWDLITELPSLTALNISMNQIVAAGAALIAQMTGLTSLDLGYNHRIGDPQLAALRSLRETGAIIRL